MHSSNRFHILAALVALVFALGGPSTAFADVSEVREVDAFTRVALDGSSDIEISVGGDQSVVVSARNNEVLERVTTEVRDGTLHVSHKGRGFINFGSTRIKVIVTLPALEGIELDGSGDIKAVGVAAEAFEIELDGSGDVDVEGSCTHADVMLDGSGDIDARHLECTSVRVDLDGSGDVTVHANVEADVRLEGSGDITVFGDPENQRVRESGSGDVHFVS